MKRDQQLVSHFLTALNRQYGASFKVLRWPDEENRQTPAVEAVASDANGETVAIEHTLVQAFEGEREDGERLMKAVGELEGHADLMKPGYNVNIVVRVGAIPKGIKWDVIGERVKEQIEKIIPIRGEGRTEETIGGLPLALSITLDIWAHDSSETDHVWLSRYEGPDTLKQVVRTALARKLPKLIAEKANRRILLLEKADFVRGHSEIRKAIDALAPDFPQLAQVDEIWLAITTCWDKEDTLFFCELSPNVMDRRLTLNVNTSLTTALGQWVGIRSA
jgi:hypothetical protein